MMMALGTFVFSLPTLVYQELQRKTSWKHAETTRLGVRAANQFLGPAADTITLPGVLVPDVAGDPFAISDLREMGDQGEPWPLVSGTGEVLGAWVITDLDETQSIFFEDGVARKTDFSLSLKQVDEPIALGAAAPASAT
ncbi:MAG: phage tail protein [Caulobacteraceae bacterium]|nr:phage tail protein [Caulobacteraceae bacterium]